VTAPQPPLSQQPGVPTTDLQPQPANAATTGPQPQASATPQPAQQQTIPPPIDSDLQVSLNPVSPAASVLLTGFACNRSSFYAADNVEIDFAFSGGPGLGATADSAAYSIDRIAPGNCQPILASVNTQFPWQSVAVSGTRVQWLRAV
jgi:hypothetical protein